MEEIGVQWDSSSPPAPATGCSRFAGRPPNERVDFTQVVIDKSLIMAGRKLAAVICSLALRSFRVDLALAPEQEDRPKAEGWR
jgi:hypothetical protein